MLAYIAPILVFGLVVFVHELGHFLAAKAVGVYTPRFSIGFGKTLFKKRWGETEYVIAMLPVGGYVRMASKEDEATAFIEGGSENSATHVATHGEPIDPEAMMPFGPKPIPADRWFESKPLWARMMILLAGVTMNILLAMVVTTGMFIHYGTPYLSTTADSVLAGRPGERAGLQRGDSIVAIQGVRLTEWEALVRKVGSSANVPLTFEILRAGQRSEIVVTPVRDTTIDPDTGKPGEAIRIGIMPGQGSKELAVLPAIGAGWNATWAMAGSVLGALKGLATREVSASQLGGPIMIAQASVQAAQGGAERLLFLIALISANLAVFNLLPIPVLDGGQIVINLLESAKGSSFSARTRDYILRAGIATVLLLFALVTYNDLKRLVVSAMERFG